MADERWLTRAQAAHFLTTIGCPVSSWTLAKKASNNNAGKGPPFRRSGWRTIRYAESELREWAQRNMERVE